MTCSTADHTHVWGPLERSRLAGTAHRKCQVSGCRVINALDDDESPDANLHETADQTDSLTCRHTLEGK